jgi:putative transposase
MKYIELCRQEGKWNVAALCRVLQVSESGYYKNLRNKSKPYKYADLLKRIYELLKEDLENANYGVKRIYEYLRNYKNFKGSYSTIYRYICYYNLRRIYSTNDG